MRPYGINIKLKFILPLNKKSNNSLLHLQMILRTYYLLWWWKDAAKDRAMMKMVYLPSSFSSHLWMLRANGELMSKKRDKYSFHLPPRDEWSCELIFWHAFCCCSQIFHFGRMLNQKNMRGECNECKYHENNLFFIFHFISLHFNNMQIPIAAKKIAS